MLALCADGAPGRHAPYDRRSIVPVRGGIDVIWRAFPHAVPNFRVKVIEMIPADGNRVVIQVKMNWQSNSLTTRARLAQEIASCGLGFLSPPSIQRHFSPANQALQAQVRD